MINSLCNLSNEKLSTLLFLIIGVLGKRCERGGREGGKRNLNKWDQGDIIEIS